MEVTLDSFRQESPALCRKIAPSCAIVYPCYLDVNVYVLEDVPRYLEGIHLCGGCRGVRRVRVGNFIHSVNVVVSDTSLCLAGPKNVDIARTLMGSLPVVFVSTITKYRRCGQVRFVHGNNTGANIAADRLARIYLSLVLGRDGQRVVGRDLFGVRGEGTSRVVFRAVGGLVRRECTRVATGAGRHPSY